MSGAWTRIAALAAKELRVVLLDKRVLTTLVISPLIQLILFGFAATLEVKNIDIGVVNRDVGVASEQFLAALEGSPNMRRIIRYQDEASLREAIEMRDVLAGAVIPPDLSMRHARGETGEIGLLLDGRRVNAAQIVAGYLGEIAATTGARLRPDSSGQSPGVTTRHLYNPNLNVQSFTLPGMIALITLVVVLSVSNQSIAREREFGTYDVLMALPYRTHEILIGKAVPASLVGLFNAILFAIVIPLVSDVPFASSLPMLALAIACFSISVTCVGLAVSSVTQNQQQAFLSAFLVIVPMFMLSGYFSPVDGMSDWMKIAADINPVSHMLVICHGVFLKGMTAAQILMHVLQMLKTGFAAGLLAWGLLHLRSN